jgi:hypothetical protein
MILFLSIEPFYTLQHDCGRPLAVTRDRKILEPNSAAIAAGVEAGMSIREAKSILGKNPSGIPSAFVDWKAEDYFDRRCKWLDACIEFTDVIEPVDQHQAYLDLSSHPSPEELVRSIQEATGASIGAGRNKWMAYCSYETKDSELLAYFVPEAFLDELPIQLMRLLEEKTRERLMFLGYRTASQLRAIPYETLRSQFGVEAELIRVCALGRGGTAVQAHYPDGSTAERCLFESPVDNLESIYRSLDLLAENIGNRLTALDLVTTHLRLNVILEESIETFERTFSKSLQSSQNIRFAARLLAEFQQPIMGLRLEALELHKSERRQNSLYIARSDSESVIDRSIGKLQKLYGEAALTRGSQIALTRRQLLMRTWKDATGWN